MGLLSIDVKKCKRDGLCGRECPAAIIHYDADRLPALLPAEEGRCMDCGHCVAICPHDALRHARIPAEKSPVIASGLVIDAARAEQFLRSRRSVRRYHSQAVEREKIQRLIEVARYAPTAGNSQTVEWLVINDKDRMRRVGSLTIDWMRETLKDPQVAAAMPYLAATVASWDAGDDTVLRGAPTLITAIAPQSAGFGLVDLTLALSYLDVFAQTLGLGTCWAGLVAGALARSAALREVMGVPEGYSNFYSIMVGYPAVQYHRVPERKTPKITYVG